MLPVARDPALTAAYRLMRRHMALKQRVSQLRHPLRAAIHLAFPELHPLIQDLTQPTSWRFLRAHPTPESIVRHGRRCFLEQGQPRRGWGQWPPEQLQHMYDLARERIGLRAPYRIDAFESKALAHDRTDALATQHLWRTQALELLEARRDCQRRLQLPRIGTPTAAAMLTAIGDVHAYTNGQPLVTLAGRDVRRFASGASIRKLPKLSHVGSGSLRHGLSHYALRLVAHDPHCTTSYQRRQHHSSGKGAGQRALMAVCDKTIRMLYRILTDHTPYTPQKDQSIAAYYAAPRTAASIGLRAREGRSGGGKPGCAFGPY